jgi:hypothetical protein
MMITANAISARPSHRRILALLDAPFHSPLPRPQSTPTPIDSAIKMGHAMLAPAVPMRVVEIP